MLRSGDPVVHDRLEFLGGHAGMRDRDDIENGAFTAGERALEVALEQRSERLFVLPLRVQRGERFHAVECEGKLEIDRLFSP
jgi:hypothetical protein